MTKKSPAKTKTCPECSRKFSPQGLLGHLRIAHGMRQEHEDPDREIVRDEGHEPEEAEEERAPRPKRRGGLFDPEGGLLS